MWNPKGQRIFEVHRRRTRPGHQDQHAAQLRQTRHPQPRAAQLGHLRPDRRPEAGRGVLSNGPGDPATADAVVAVTREVLGAGIPLFGICFGNQILGRALGRSTYKMTFGHRGINIPVLDRHRAVAITAQNHGFALEGRRRGVRHAVPGVVSHTCANDGVVEGIRLLDGRAFSVQYHPEAAAGPDAEYLFDQFVDLMAGEGSRACVSVDTPPDPVLLCTLARRNRCHVAPTSTTSW
jgi:anthranilate/para-aminobenzoate synthase component II